MIIFAKKEEKLFIYYVRFADHTLDNPVSSRDTEEPFG
jgi:hypothetical protein